MADSSPKLMSHTNPSLDPGRTKIRINERETQSKTVMKKINQQKEEQINYTEKISKLKVNFS